MPQLNLQRERTADARAGAGAGATTGAPPRDRAHLREAIRRIDGGYGDPALRAVQPTGLAALDEALPGGGVPVGAVTECLGTAGDGRSRFTLWLMRQTLAASSRPALLIESAPPSATATAAKPGGRPCWRWYPPAIAQAGVPLARLLVVRPGTVREALWTAEQGLRSAALAMLVLPEVARLDATAVRRLQLAAEASGAVVVLPRPAAAVGERSPAPVRLAFAAEPVPAAARTAQPHTQAWRIQVLRCRGGTPGRTLTVQAQANAPAAAAGTATATVAAGSLLGAGAG